MFYQLSLFCLNSYSQVSEKTIIKGTVTDELTGNPVPFASVFLKGTTVGTLTDNNGKYRIETSFCSHHNFILIYRI